MKILNRLNEEGSNADEPLNIKLSDYSRYILYIFSFAILRVYRGIAH